MIDAHLINDLEMCLVPRDLSLYGKRFSSFLEGMRVTYVDNCLNAVTSEFEKLMKQTLFNFDSMLRVYNRFDFYGA